MWFFEAILESRVFAHFLVDQHDPHRGVVSRSCVVLVCVLLVSGCGDRCVAHFEREDGAACRHVARDFDRASKLERGGGHDHKGVLKAFVSSLVALFWECTFNSAHMLVAGPARCGFLVFLCAVYGYAVKALDIGLVNREANRA